VRPADTAWAGAGSVRQSPGRLRGTRATTAGQVGATDPDEDLFPESPCLGVCVEPRQDRSRGFPRSWIPTRNRADHSPRDPAQDGTEEVERRTSKRVAGGPEKSGRLNRPPACGHEASGTFVPCLCYTGVT